MLPTVRRALSISLLLLLIACHAKQQPAPAADASAAIAVSAAAAPPSSSSSSSVAVDSGKEFPTIAMPRPTVSGVPLDAPPDVRITAPDARKAVVRAGQTFGIFLPERNDFLEEWQLEPHCPLGEPLAIIARGP